MLRKVTIITIIVIVAVVIYLVKDKKRKLYFKFDVEDGIQEDIPYAVKAWYEGTSPIIHSLFWGILLLVYTCGDILYTFFQDIHDNIDWLPYSLTIIFIIIKTIWLKIRH
jgi:Na+/proline symporter